MKVLFLHPFNSTFATYRARMAAFFPALRAAGVECTVSALRDGGNAVALARNSVERVKLLSRLREFDLVVVYHRVFPYVPGFVERRILEGVPYVYDFDDAIYLEENLVERGKTEALIAGAAAVIPGSGELARYARQWNANVIEIPTVVDLAKYPRAVCDLPGRPDGAPFTIGWMGAPITTHYLRELAGPLRRLTASRGARFVTVGASRIELPGVKLVQREWSEERELEDLLSFDVGVMPLSDDEWSRGKCGFKLVQYMAAGIPGIASHVGANRQIVDHGKTGLLASSPEDWVAALEALASDPAARLQMGRAARERAKRYYSLEVAAPAFVRALLDAASAGRNPSGMLTA